MQDILLRSYKISSLQDFLSSNVQDPVHGGGEKEFL